jgi:hypothetical protein
MLYSSDLKLPTYQKPEQSLYCSKWLDYLNRITKILIKIWSKLR